MYIMYLYNIHVYIYIYAYIYIYIYIYSYAVQVHIYIYILYVDGVDGFSGSELKRHACKQVPSKQPYFGNPKPFPRNPEP